MKFNLNQIMLYIDNVEKAKEFYVGILGFEFIRENFLENNVKFYTLKSFNTIINLFPKKYFEGKDLNISTGFHSFLMEVSNLNDTIKYLNEKGIKTGEIIDREYDIVSNVADFEGNYMAFYQNKIN